MASGNPIIRSLLDSDLYKLTMAQAVLHQFPSAHVEYKFACRTPDRPLDIIAKGVQKEIDSLADLRLTDDEAAYLSGLRFMKPDFVEFMRLFRLNPSHVRVRTTTAGCGLDIRISGPWLHTIWFEIPILAIVNELYFRGHAATNLRSKRERYKIGLGRLKAKMALVARGCQNVSGFPFLFSDFGTRRRFSAEWQDIALREIRESPAAISFAGTSNVMLAHRIGLRAIGTMAHEWIQAGQQVGVSLAQSQRHMLDTWAREYRGDLGIALTDTIGLDAFLGDFDLFFAKLYDGVRHDSGDPIIFGQKVIEHYRKLGIDPRMKTAVFSDGLDFKKALDIWQAFRRDIKMSFGIGTNLMNDMGVAPLNIVIKMVKCNGSPVAKLSDSPGKNMCEDPAHVAELRRAFRL